MRWDDLRWFKVVFLVQVSLQSSIWSGHVYLLHWCVLHSPLKSSHFSLIFSSWFHMWLWSFFVHSDSGVQKEWTGSFAGLQHCACFQILSHVRNVLAVWRQDSSKLFNKGHEGLFQKQSIHLIQGTRKNLVISPQKTKLHLNFFTRTLMWFSFSSSFFFKVSISLWFSNNSIRRWWLWVSHTACNQQLSRHLMGF